MGNLAIRQSGNPDCPAIGGIAESPDCLPLAPLASWRFNACIAREATRSVAVQLAPRLDPRLRIPAITEFPWIFFDPHV
jgi:hypothetical protein